MKKTLTVATVVAAALLPAPATAAPAPAAPDPTGIQVLADVKADPDHSTSFRGQVYFRGTTTQAGSELWVTDGTPAGTRLLADLRPGPVGSNPGNFAVLGDRLYFTATDASGNEWWSTDGSAAGTAPFVDINVGGSAFPAEPVVVGRHLFFSADDGRHGRELWQLDGNPGGTRIVVDLQAGVASGDPQELTAFGDRVVYRARPAPGVSKPWTSLPGEFGAQRLDVEPADRDILPYDFTPVGDLLVFGAGNQFSGAEVWVTAGRPGDAHGIRDVYPGPTSSFPSMFTTVGDRVLFAATTPDSGREVWSTDGTSAGTVLVADAVGGAAGSSPASFVALGNSAVFGADDGVHGRELWVTRGTAQSTRLVLDGYPGSASGLGVARAGRHPLGGRLLYGGTDGAGGVEPWVTDGTAAGTRRLADLAPGLTSSTPYDVGTIGDAILFGANDGSGDHLYSWRETPAAGQQATSTTTVTVKRRYPAKQARLRRITVPVRVSSAAGGVLSGGSVTLTRRGQTVGTATLVDGVAQVRITVRLKPGRRHVLVASWSGTTATAGSTSAPVTVKVAKTKKGRNR